MSSLSPSQVRARILEDHEALRDRLDMLSRIIVRLKANDPNSLSELTAPIAGFYSELLEHLQFEDEWLVTTLRSIDAWGELRAERLAAHHDAQREELRAFLTTLRDASPQQVVDMLTAFIDHLHVDMQSEELELLSPQLLRDDVVTIEGEAG